MYVCTTYYPPLCWRRRFDEGDEADNHPDGDFGEGRSLLSVSLYFITLN
jgi:hypothetical protein